VSMKRKCDRCGSAVEKKLTKRKEGSRKTNTMPNEISSVNVGQHDMEYRPTVNISEAILLNPNSYKNIETILLELKEIA